MKVLSDEIHQVVSKYQGIVESEGYQLELLLHPSHVRTYAVRFRPVVSDEIGGPNFAAATMPVLEHTNEKAIFMEQLLVIFGTLIPLNYFINKMKFE